MIEQVNKTAVGIFVVAIFLFSIMFISWIAKGLGGRAYHTYMIVMHESVAGLAEKSPVKYNGVDVGIVAKVAIDDVDPAKVRILINVDKRLQLRQGVTATLISRLTGSSFIELKGGKVNAPLIVKLKDQPYPIINSKPSFMGTMDVSITDITNNLKQITDRLNELLDKKNEQAIETILQNGARLTTELEGNRQLIQSTMHNLSILSQQLSVSTKHLPNLIQQTKASMISMAKTSAVYRQAGYKLNATLQHSQRFMSLLSQQWLPSSLQTLSKVDRLADHLDSLTIQIQQHPSILVRGAQAPNKGPGE